MSIGEFVVERFAEISTITLHIFFLYRTLDTKAGKKASIITIYNRLNASRKELAQSKL